MDAGAGGAPLALVLAPVGAQGFAVHPGKYKLAYPPACLQLDGAAVGVEQLQGDLPLEAGVYPARVLDEQAHPAQAATALHKGRQVVGQDEIFHRCGKDELAGQQYVCIAPQGLVGNLPIHRDDPGGGVLYYRKRVP